MMIKGRTFLVAVLCLVAFVFFMDLKAHFESAPSPPPAQAWKPSLTSSARATLEHLSSGAASGHQDDPELSDLLAQVRAQLDSNGIGKQAPAPAAPAPAPVRKPEPVVQAPAPAPAPAPAQQLRGRDSSPSWGAGVTRASAVSTNSAKTQFQCFTSADWAQLCVYSNLCWDGDKAVIFDDSKEAGSAVPRHFQVGDNAVGHHTFDVYPRPPKETQGLPRNTRAKAYYKPSAVLRGETDTKLTWTDEAMWIVEPEYRGYEVQHPFFWAHTTFGIWEAQHSNETWGGVIPPLDRIYLPIQQNVELGAWNTETLNLMRQPQTKILTQRETNAAGVGPKNLVCSKRAVITGHKPNVFSGIAPCYMYRDAMYKRIGITGADRANAKDRYPPHHLVIWSRKGRRGFSNEAQMLELVKSYKIPYTLITNHGSFEDQVKLMSTAGVLLLAHGAAATNTIFQPHRSVLIEVFPYLRKRFGFGNMATNCGNFYYPIFTWEKDPTDSGVNSKDFAWKCEHRSAIDTNFEATCDQASKGGNIRVPIDVLERTLIDAFDTIGKRIYKGGIRKPRPTRPPTSRAETLDTWTDPWLDE